jgi:hypothetical protein
VKKGGSMRQLTEKEAIALHDSKVWEEWDDEKIATFQFYQDRLCIPFDKFQGAFEKVIGRPVWTHEFTSSNRERLMAEFEGKAGHPSLEDILNLLPQDKLILVVESKDLLKQ